MPNFFATSSSVAWSNSTFPLSLASGAPLFAGIISGVIGGIVVGFLSKSHVSVSGPAAGLTAIVLTAITTLGNFPALILTQETLEKLGMSIGDEVSIDVSVENPTLTMRPMAEVDRKQTRLWQSFYKLEMNCTNV